MNGRLNRGRLNPGSDAAREQGCICAVLDNNWGRFAPWPPDGWWITEGCPVHHFADGPPPTGLATPSPAPSHGQGTA